MQGPDEDEGIFIAEATNNGMLDNVEGGSSARDFLLEWTEDKAPIVEAPIVYAPDSPIKRRRTPDGSVTLPQQRVNFVAPLVSPRTMLRVKSESSIAVGSTSLSSNRPTAYVAKPPAAVAPLFIRSPSLPLLPPSAAILRSRSLVSRPKEIINPIFAPALAPQPSPVTTTAPTTPLRSITPPPTLTQRELIRLSPETRRKYIQSHPHTSFAASTPSLVGTPSFTTSTPLATTPAVKLMRPSKENADYRRDVVALQMKRRRDSDQSAIITTSDEATERCRS